jgi:PAS domain S-box-containing protein
VKITTKILITTLPLVVLGLLGLGWMTSSLSERSLNQLGEKWLNTKLLAAIQIAEENFRLLTRYELQDIPANVKKAQDATAKDMRSIRIGQSGFILVVDASGSILISFDQSQIGRNVSSESWFQAIEDKKKGRGTFIQKGVAYLTVQQYFEPWQWYVLACAPQSEVYGGVDQMRSYVLGAAGLSAVIVALFLVLLIRRITAPLHMLAREAERIGRGDLKTRISVASSDEIGTLADAFNNMTVRLEQTIEELRTSEKKYRSIFENAVEGIYQTTIEGQIMSANPAMARILAYDSPDELVAALTDVRRQLYVHPEDRDLFLTAILDRDVVLGLEFQYYRKDGQKIWVSLNARMVRDESSAPLFFEGFLTDITERKRAEEALRKRNEELERFERAVIGRELKMIELKKRIAELEEKYHSQKGDRHES